MGDVARAGARTIPALLAAAAAFSSCGGRAVEHVFVEVAADAGPAAPDADAAAHDAPASAPPDPSQGSAAWVSSGARLHAIVWRAKDGAKQFTGTWLDTTRSEECSFRIAADGRERCLPQVFALHRAGAPFRHYTDPNCSNPIVSRRPTPECTTTAPEIRYVTPSPSAGVVHAVGARRYPPAAWYLTGDGVCVPETSPDVEYFDVGPEVPPSAFVGAELIVEPGPGRLGWLTRRGEDGSRQRLRAFDEALGASCAPSVTTDDFVRCGPWTPANVFFDLFTDPSCKTFVAACPAASCGNPTPPERTAYAARGRQDVGRLRHTFFRIGPLPSYPAPAYRMTSGACTPSGSLPASRGAVLEELAPSAMVPLAATFEATPTRLRRSVFEAPALPGPPATVYGSWDVWQDAALQTTCRIEGTADGETRCVPEVTAGPVSFLDERCTDEPVVSHVHQSRRWARFFDTSEILRGCSVLPRLRAVESAPVQSASHYQLAETKDGIACVRYDASTPTTYARLGADVTDTFERFDRVVE